MTAEEGAARVAVAMVGNADLAGHIRDARSVEDPCEHRVGQAVAVCAPCLRDRIAPHVAATVAAALGAGEGSEAAGLCSQCGELEAVMVKVGTSDGWCTDCLDACAFPPGDSAKVLLWAADEMSAVIADGDVAEVASPVPGEVGRATCVERRDFLLEDPVDWLRALAARAGGDDTNGGEAA